jgi:metalloprotease
MRLTKISLILALPLLLNGCPKQGSFNLEQAMATGAAGAIQAVSLSEDTVKEASAAAAQEMDSKSQVAPANNPYAKRLANLTRGLENADGLNLNFKLYLADEVNAFAMADGTIRVYKGLMDAMPDDQVLAVIGHEIGHVRLRHSYKQMRERLLTDTAFGALASGGGGIGALSSSELGQIAYIATNARFSQRDELDADTYAVKMLHGMGKDPYAMKRAIETLENLHGGGGSFLSSHPSNKQRAAKIQAAIDRL